MSLAAVSEMLQQFEAHGATASVGPAHLTAWFGHHYKLTMTRWLMQEKYGVDLARIPEAYVFIGCALSDREIFNFFPNAVDVADPEHDADRIARCMGFVELAKTSLATRTHRASP